MIAAAAHKPPLRRRLAAARGRAYLMLKRSLLHALVLFLVAVTAGCQAHAVWYILQTAPPGP